MPRHANEPDTSKYIGQVAAIIRGRRERSRLSVEEAATAAGVSPQTWYAWEQGRSLPLGRLPAIATALGCRPQELLPETKKAARG